MKNITFLFLFLTSYFQSFAQEPNPALFQTWYLIAQHSDLGPSYYYTPSTSRQITINPDLTFVAVDNCAIRTGNFIYSENSEYSFIRPENHVIDDSECANGESSGVFWELAEESDLRMEVYHSDNEDFFTFEISPGFGNDFTNNLLSVGDQLLNLIKIYPNPTTDILRIQDDNNLVTSYSIVDVLGKTVMPSQSYNSQEIDLSSLNSGIYFIKVISEEGSNTLKFIKK